MKGRPRIAPEKRNLTGTVTLRKEQWEGIERAATSMHASLSEVVRRAVDLYLLKGQQEPANDDDEIEPPRLAKTTLGKAVLPSEKFDYVPEVRKRRPRGYRA